MSSEGKAKALATLAKEHGWTGSIDMCYDSDTATLKAQRDGESFLVEWCSNQLNAPPSYEFGGVESNLHCVATVKRVIKGKPDLEAYMKRRRRQKAVPQNTSSQPDEVSGPVEDQTIEITQHQLPFELDVTPDNKILKEIRGSTIIWYNSISGAAEISRVPIDKNRDLENVFFIGESGAGRAYLSFMDPNGMFRAVGLDAILQVR